MRENGRLSDAEAGVEHRLDHRGFFLFGCCLVLVSAVVKAGPLELEVKLIDAVFQQDPGETGRSVICDLRRDGDAWSRFFAVAGNFNPNLHAGFVVESAIDEQTIRLKLEINFRGDPYVPGGRGRFDVMLKREPGGQLAGTFSGRFRGQDRQGRAVGVVWPTRPPLPAGFTLPPAGEHPRILFRKADVPKLREKANTPFGRTMLERFEGAAGAGMRYQLTGEPRFADEARVLVEKLIADMSNGDKMVRSRVWGWRLEQVALAYDLCYDAWPADFRRRVADHLVFASERLFFSRSLFHKEISWQYAANYPGTILYGTAFAGLALYDEKGPAPTRPAKPYADRDPLAFLAPDASTPEGVPVVPFVDDEMPDRWLFVGGFKPRGADLLAELGGYAKARPKPGDRVVHDGREEVFRLVPTEPGRGYHKDGYTQNKLAIDITNAIGRVFFSTSLFYTVIRNDTDRFARLELGHGGAVAYIGGSRVSSGEVVRLGKGLYPVLVVVEIGDTTPWGRIFMRPRFVELTEDQARSAVADASAAYDAALADWSDEHARWERSGGVDPRFARLFAISRQIMYRSWREGIGDQGVQNSRGFPMGLDNAVRYASAYRNVFGENLSPREDISHYLLFKLFSVVHSPAGPVAVDLNGEPLMKITDVYHETRDLSLEFFAALFPLTPEPYKPAVLGFWHRYAGLDPAEPDYSRLAAKAKRDYDYSGFDALPIYVFVNYPLDLAPRSAETLPRSLVSQDTGYVGARNQWKDADDFLVQLYGRGYVHGNNSRENAGTLRIQGLGATWSHGAGAAHGERFGENVVQFPEDEINLAGRGKLLHAETRPDGGVVAVFDLDEVMAGIEQGDAENPPNPYERYGNLPIAGMLRESPRRATRSVAVDYSGACGAPALIVIADRTSGAKRAVWTWQVESRRESAGRGTDVQKQPVWIVEWQGQHWTYKVGHLIREDRKRVDGDPSVQVNDRGFMLKRGQATLSATFVTPAKPVIEFGERSVYTQTAKSGISRAFSRAIFVEGGNDFLVVMTIQQGEPPEVRVEGSGLDATIHVGGQTVRLNGAKIVLGR